MGNYLGKFSRKVPWKMKSLYKYYAKLRPVVLFVF